MSNNIEIVATSLEDFKKVKSLLDELNPDVLAQIKRASLEGDPKGERIRAILFFSDSDFVELLVQGVLSAVITNERGVQVYCDSYLFDYPYEVDRFQVSVVEYEKKQDGL